MNPGTPKKRRAYRLPPCPAYDVEGTESWLSDMAREGLHLAPDGFLLGFAAFERGAPAQVRYRLAASLRQPGLLDDNGGGPDPEAVELGREMGWEYVARRGDFYLYRTARPGARELVLLACLCGLGVAGRGAFFWAPQCKPVTALTILTGVSLGGQAGFLVGAVTMLVSNLFFGQGPWTPWQMFAMGCIGGLAGSLFSRRGRRPRKGMLCLFGFLAAVVLYGAVMNTASVLLWSHSLQWELIAAACAAGLPMDLLHGGSTALLLYLLADPVQGKLDRMREKYGWGRG